MGRIIYFLGVTLLLFTVTGCGFQPVYGTRDNSPSQWQAVPSLQKLVIEQIPGRDGQILRVALEDGIRPNGEQPASQDLRLSVDMNIKKQPVIIELDGRITRYNLEIIARYRVTNLSSGKILHRDTARRISSYNVASSDFSTFIAERDARERGLKALADQMLMQLAAALEPVNGL